MDGWMDHVQFYVLLNNISVALSQWMGDTEKPWKLIYDWEDSRPSQAGLEFYRNYMICIMLN